MVPLYFPAFAVSPSYVLIHRDMELGALCQREHATFIFVYVSVSGPELSQYDLFNFLIGK